MTEILRSVDGVRLLVLTNLESAFTDRWRGAGVEVLVRPHLWRAMRLGSRRFSRPRQAWRAAGSNLLAYRFLRSLGAPVIHFNDGIAFGCIGLGAAGAGMTSTIDIRSQRRPIGPGERLGLLACDRVITLSDDLAAWLKGLRWMPGLAAKVAVIPSGVDRERLAAAGSVSSAVWRRRFGIDDAEVAIGVVGRVSPDKQQGELVSRTIPAITSAAAWRLYFLGDVHPPGTPHARRFAGLLAESAYADRMVHLGFTRETFGWYRALDLVVVCSRYEGLSRAMIEAASSGVPVVSFDVCSARDLLGQGCGVVVAERDFAGLADALSAVIDDPRGRRRMGEIGRQIGVRFDSRLTGQAYRALYAALLDSRRLRGTRRRDRRIRRAARRTA